MTARVRTPLEDFHNRLRILISIDLFELNDAGLHMDRQTWTDFGLNPWRWFMLASDDARAKLWAIMDKRSGMG